MTHSPQKFSIFSPYPNNKKIATVDGFLATMANQGEVRLNKSIVLKNVLHVTKLSTNLVFIRRLTKELNCHVFLSLSLCISRTRYREDD